MANSGALEVRTLAREGRNLEHLCLSVQPYNYRELSAQLEKLGVAVGEEQQDYGAEGDRSSFYRRPGGKCD